MAEKDEISEFLKKLSMKQNGGEPKTTPLTSLVTLPSVALILGNVGMGKSALGYYLLELLSELHSLTPVVVNLPSRKRDLLPENYVIKDLAGLKHTENCIALIDEGTTTLPAGTAKLEEMVKAFNSLCRQRNQIIILIFHSSKDVGSRILRGVGTILLKEPSQRQIQYGSKDKFMRELLTEAKAKFKGLQEIGEDARAYTYVDCEKPEFRGMVKNDLPSFWLKVMLPDGTSALSKAWTDVDVDTGDIDLPIFARKQPTTEELLIKYGVPPDKFELVIALDREYTLEQLRQICYEKELPIGGDKKKLITQLMEIGYFR